MALPLGSDWRSGKAMQLQQIRYFLAVCKCRSFTRAAHDCNVSQPSLTVAIQRLELELGGRLFDRGGRVATLTPLGRHLNRDLRATARAAMRVARRAQEFTSTGSIAIPSKGVSNDKADVDSSRSIGPRWNGSNGSRGARAGGNCIGSIYNGHPSD